ncbi:unnamed protein product [Knipowitschia caucasica]
MEDQDRVSQASSVATISYFPRKDSDGKVQTFGKRSHSVKRDPNCPVVIRGWLYKKDSSGLKLWKRRWFVLSNYCLFYYKDSREESVLGSIPLPSYRILFCTPRECKSRKFTFKVVHQGMRSYFFSADTQEDMLGWVRALSQSAAMDPGSAMSRRCSSYQDFTHIGGSIESVDLPLSPSDGEGPSHRHVSRTLSEPGPLRGGRMGMSHQEPRGRRSVRHRHCSPGTRTPSPQPRCSRRRLPGQADSVIYVPVENSLHSPVDMMGTSSLPSRAQLGSRPHTPVGRVDIRPQDDPTVLPHTLYYAPASPKLEFKSTPTTPVTERWQKPVGTYGSVHLIPNVRRPLGKSFSTGANTDLLPPLPPSSKTPQHHHHHHHHHRNHLSVCVLPPTMSTKPELKECQPIRPLEGDADVVLTRLCGCDKLLHSLSMELAQLQIDKDSVHCALEVSRLQLEEWNNQGPQVYEEVFTQKALLQEDLVTIRARMCDVSLEMENVWSQYERMESELSVIRSHLQHICNFGVPEDQSQAQRELWMMEDILSGLKTNREHFRFLLGIQRHHMFQPPSPHPGSPVSPTARAQSGSAMDVDQEPPARPPLPQELSQDQDWTEPPSPYEGVYSHREAGHRRGHSQPDLLHVNPHTDSQDSNISKCTSPDSILTSTKTRMSEEEQMERMKMNKQKPALIKRPQSLSVQSQPTPCAAEEQAPFPLRVTRVVTAVLPSSLVARKVSVEDPPPELDVPLPEQIQQEAEQDQGPELCPDPGLGGGASRTTEHRAAEGGVLFPSEAHPDLCWSSEQREAKLRRVERIRERVIRSAVRESSSNQLPTLWREGQAASQGNLDATKKLRQAKGREQEEKSKCAKSLKQTSASQDPTEEADLSKGKSPGGNKTHQKDHSGRRGVTKAKLRRPASPYHVSPTSMQQKHEGDDCAVSKGKETQRPEDGGCNENGSSISPGDVRAQWFLSNGQWEGTVPLQKTDQEEEENPGTTMEESHQMSPEVSQSLEKMKQNHSLFYKIACDISISDSDITRTDGGSNMQTIAEELQITEEGEESKEKVQRRSNNIVKEGNCEIREEVLGDISSQDDQVSISDRTEVNESSQNCTDSSGEQTKQATENTTEEMKTCESNGDHNPSEPSEPSETEQLNGGSLTHNACLGSTRVTVLRTSL